GPPPGDLVEPGIGVMGLAGLEPFVLENAGDEIANVVFVVNNQNIERHQLDSTACNCGSSSLVASGCAPPASVSSAAAAAGGVAEPVAATGLPAASLSSSCPASRSGRVKVKQAPTRLLASGSASINSTLP